MGTNALPPPPAGYAIATDQLPPPPLGYAVKGGPNSSVKPLSFAEHLSEGASEFLSAINPVGIAKGIYKTATDIPGAVKAYGQANQAIAEKAENAFKSGNYGEGVRHVVGYLMNAIPGLGSAADEAGDKVQAGHAGAGFGQAAGTALAMAAPEVLPAKATVAKVASGSAKVADAIKFGMDHDIPVDLATTTDNSFVRGAQQVASSSLGGSLPATAGKAAQAKAMTRVSGELADATYPGAVTPESAGTELQEALGKSSETIGGQAQTAYSRLAKIERDPRNLRTVQTGTRQFTSSVLDPASGQPITQTVPVTQKIAVPVDVGQIQDWAKTQLDTLKQRWAAADPQTAQSIGQQVKSLQSIVDGPQFKPASVAEKDLGALKALVRNTDPATESSLNAGKVVDQLQSSIDNAVSKAGPDALSALQEGRAKWATKMDIEQTIKKLRDEPVQTFSQLIWKDDTGVDFLRKVAAQAPAEMPKVARAYLQQLFDKATAEGGFSRGDSAFRNWQNLGPETKKILFNDPSQIKNLDNFFQLAKRMNAVPNPSGTAPAMMAGRAIDMVSGGLLLTNPVSGAASVIAPAALTSLMYSPRFVKMLNNGLQAPVRSSARTLAIGKLLSMAGDEAKPYAPETIAQPQPNDRLVPALAQ